MYLPDKQLFYTFVLVLTLFEYLWHYLSNWPSYAPFFFFFFQKILLLENPEPYLIQRQDTDSAIILENATLSWTRPEKLSKDQAEHNGENEHKEDSEFQMQLNKATLKNISFALPKVSSRIRFTGAK